MLNGIWKGPFHKQVGSLSRGLKMAFFVSEMFQVELPCFRGLNSGRSVSTNVNKRKKHFSWNNNGARMFTKFVEETGKHCLQCQFLFPRCKLCLRCTAGNFNENPIMQALAKFLRARASEHSSHFCEQFEQKPNFASTFKLDGTIPYSYTWQWLGGRVRTPLKSGCYNKLDKKYWKTWWSYKQADRKSEPLSCNGFYDTYFSLRGPLRQTCFQGLFPDLRPALKSGKRTSKRGCISAPYGTEGP